MRRVFVLALCTSALTATPSIRAAQPQVVRTADPVKRGFRESDFPRTVKVTDNVYTYEDFHAGDEKFTTTNMFVVTEAGILVADGQGDPTATRRLVEAIGTVTAKPIKYVVIGSTSTFLAMDLPKKPMYRKRSSVPITRRSKR